MQADWRIWPQVHKDFTWVIYSNPRTAFLFVINSHESWLTTYSWVLQYCTSQALSRLSLQISTPRPERGNDSCTDCQPFLNHNPNHQSYSQSSIILPEGETELFKPSYLSTSSFLLDVSAWSRVQLLHVHQSPEKASRANIVRVA